MKPLGVNRVEVIATEKAIEILADLGITKEYDPEYTSKLVNLYQAIHNSILDDLKVEIK